MPTGKHRQRRLFAGFSAKRPRLSLQVLTTGMEILFPSELRDKVEVSVCKGLVPHAGCRTTDPVAHSCVATCEWLGLKAVSWFGFERGCGLAIGAVFHSGLAPVRYFGIVYKGYHLNFDVRSHSRHLDNSSRPTLSSLGLDHSGSCSASLELMIVLQHSGCLWDGSADIMKRNKATSR